MATQAIQLNHRSFKDLVWDATFEAHHLAQYYPLYEQKLQRAHTWATWRTIGLTAVAALLIIIGLVFFTTTDNTNNSNKVETYGTLLGGLGSTLLSIASVIWGHSGETVKNITLATIAATRWRHLAAEWRLLWAHDNLGGDTSIDIWHRLQDEGRLAQLETECGPMDTKLSDKSAKEAQEVLSQIFQSSTNRVGEGPDV